MVTIAELLDWQPAQLSSVVDNLLKQRRELTDLQDELDDSAPPATWYSGAGENARTEHEGLRSRLLDMVAEVSKVASSVDFAEEAMKTAKQGLQEALTYARGQGFDVNHASGEVSDPKTYEGDAPSRFAAIRQVEECARRISAALTAADSADADLAGALREANRGEVEHSDSSLAAAAQQLPGAIDDMSPAEIAQRYADDVAIETVQAYLEGELEFATWEIEGAANANYVVEADGEVKMQLHLEGGLGREIDVGEAEADVSGGVTTDLELTFESQEEAEEFLANLDDEAMDLDITDTFRAPEAVAENVADYVMEQDVSSFRVGVYGQGEVEFDTSFAEGEATGRIEGYHDFVRDEYGLKVTASADAAFGGPDSGFSGSGELSGEVKLNHAGETNEVTFRGEVDGTVANERLGLDLPNTSTGQGVDVELKMDRSSEHFDEFDDAMRSGDLDGAAGLALDHGRVVVRQTSVETIAQEEHDVDLKVAGGEVEYGASAESANMIWVRPPDQDAFVPLDPAELR